MDEQRVLTLRSLIIASVKTPSRGSLAMPIESIDVFCHFLPRKYCEAVQASTSKPLWMFERAQRIAAMVDLDARLEVLEEFSGYRQIISLASPPTESLAPSNAAELTQLANDELARTTTNGGTRICGFVAALPLNDVAASVKEARRAVEQLGAVGVQVFTSVLGRPLDDPEFQPLFQVMAELDCPVLLHPTRAKNVPDYPQENSSIYDLWWAIGWPHETTLALIRLAFSGIFDRLPNLKIIAHHVGGYLPMMGGRLGPGMDLLGTRIPPGATNHIKPPVDEPVLKACARFYADTASFGWQAAIECGKAFFGTERLLFATDMPFDSGGGPDYIRSTLAAIDAMELSDSERQKILSGNARRFFNLGD